MPSPLIQSQPPLQTKMHCQKSYKINRLIVVMWNQCIVLSKVLDCI